MTTKIKIYNEALLICGERSLSSVTEAREPRYLLDTVWDNGGVDSCLASGQWKFAMRTIMLDYESGISPTFGYQRAFTKPSDWVATSAIANDEFFNSPLLEYVDETGYWYADLDVLYIRYVSNDTNYGTDYASWPAKFAEFVSAHFAYKISLKLTADKEKREQIAKYRNKALLEAKNHDAMSDPTKFPPSGSWVSARRGGSTRNRGNRHRLIG